MIDIKQVNKKTMGEQVLDILRKDIMLGELKSGFHLKETVLSKELGVSRGPIREAIVKLENEGLVSTPSNGRTVVEGFSKKDIENLYNTRIQIEKYGISQLTVDAIEGGKKDLYHCVELMEAGHQRGERDVEADLLFHFLLIKLTGNKTLIQLWKSLNGLIKTLIYVTTDFIVQQRNIIDEHIRIIKCLESRDFDQAKVEVENHLLAALEFYKKAAINLREDENIK